jgi:threonine aldolase
VSIVGQPAADVGPLIHGRDVIDLRTDTITLPSPEMRAAMAEAVVGDDFYHEDPTVQAFEERAAALLGKEAGLYVPSGTMANLLAHLGHVPEGGEVIGPEPAHTFQSEVGGPWRIAGVTVRTIPQVRGELDVDRYAALTHPSGALTQATRLYWVEQPTRGYVVQQSDLAALRRVAHEQGVPIHMDGARIFNASVTLGVPAAAIAAQVDTLMFCVSKGLAAPVGSVLLGPRAFIERARHYRQMLGGGMRQAGIVAAAGLFALDHNVTRLAEDHANARRLAAGLAGLRGLRLDRDEVQTNIFYVEVDRSDETAVAFADRLAAEGVRVNRPGPGRRTLRFVTHYGIEATDIEEALARAGRVAGSPTVDSGAPALVGR